MKITKDTVLEACQNLNMWGLDDLMADLLECEEIDKNSDASEIARDCIDNNLIYDDDIWSIMQEYQNPQNANYNEAIESFENDLTTIIEHLIDNITEEEEED